MWNLFSLAIMCSSEVNRMWSNYKWSCLFRSIVFTNRGQTLLSEGPTFVSLFLFHFLFYVGWICGFLSIVLKHVNVFSLFPVLLFTSLYYDHCFHFVTYIFIGLIMKFLQSWFPLVSLLCVQPHLYHLRPMSHTLMSYTCVDADLHPPWVCKSVCFLVSEEVVCTFFPKTSS